MARRRGVGFGWIVVVVVLAGIVQYVGRVPNGSGAYQPPPKTSSTTYVVPDSSVSKNVTREASTPLEPIGTPDVAASPTPEPPPDDFLLATHSVKATSLRVRGLPTTTAEILANLPQGAPVQVLASSDGWALIDLADGRQGWVSSEYLVPLGSKEIAVAARPAPSPIPQPQKDLTPVRDQPIRAAYIGTCDCPYDIKRNGASCGRTSAYSRPGGKSPTCYVGDRGAASTPLQSPKAKPSKPACSESGSCFGDVSTATGRPKTVYVPGYYRKNGTYVRGYYRS